MAPSDTDGSSRQSSVSRRRFLRVAGVSGVTVAAAGCTTDSGGGGGNGNGSGNGSGGGGGSGSGTVEIATSSLSGNEQAFVQSLREGGLSEDVEVSFLSTSDISGDVQSQYRQWLQASRSKPDLMRMDSGWTIPFIKRDQLVNLSDTLSSETVDAINQNYFDAAVSTAKGEDGNLYGVPYQVGLPTIQYRKDLVTEAGFDPEGENWATEPMTWKKFSEVISQTKQQSDIQFGYSWQAKNYVGLACCTFNELMSSWGGAYFGGRENLFGPVGDRPITVDEQPVIDALKMGRTFVQGPDDEHALEGYQQISPTNVLQWTEGPSQDQFVNGNAVALRYWPSSIPKAADSFGDDLGVMPIPYGVPPEESQYEGLGGTSSALGGWHMTLNPNSENPDAAAQVLEAMTSEPFRQFQLETLDLLPPDTAALSQEKLQDLPVWGNYADTLKIAGENAVPRPVTVVWPDQSPAIAEKVNAVLAGQQAPEDAMADLKGTLQDLENSA